MRFCLSTILLFVILISFSFAVPGDEKTYPKDYFRSPVSNTLRLSGTFGELRPNHFHSGIDIKGTIGQTLYAAADGYISRIKVQKNGYGKVLYLTHAEGYTTVYAHMNNFTPQLEQYIKNHQYDREKFEIELFPGKDEWVFKKGETIGAMGTTGSSFGPHLHFEIRDSKTEKPINPLLFGLTVADKQAPRMHQLRIYHLDDKHEALDAKTYDLVKKGDRYVIPGNPLTIGAWRAGFALKVYDHMDGVSNWNGIYALDTYVDDELVYHFEMKDFSFSETRYLNAHLDYGEQVANRAYFHRCYRMPGNRLSIYSQAANDGVVTLYADQPSKITMVARDVAGNTSKLEFQVQRGEVPRPEPRAYNYVLLHDQENAIEKYSMRVSFPKGSFYETLYMNYTADEEKSDGVYSAVHSLHDYRTPVHRYFNLAIRPTLLPDKLKDKAFIAYCGKGERVTNYGGEWKNGMLHTRARALGDYCIMVDKTPPTVKPVIFRSDLRGYNKMTFKIGDNYPSSGRAKGLTYRAEIDGEWALMEYDAKNDLLTYHFDGRLDPGKHSFRLVVSDSQRNTKTYKGTFLR